GLLSFSRSIARPHWPRCYVWRRSPCSPPASRCGDLSNTPSTSGWATRGFLSNSGVYRWPCGISPNKVLQYEPWISRTARESSSYPRANAGGGHTMSRRGKHIVAGLDIGTTKICAIIGEVKSDGVIDVIGIGTH